MTKQVLLTFLFLFISVLVKALDITGNFNVCGGATEEYTYTGTGTSCTLNWTVTGGVFIDNNSTNISVSTITSKKIKVKWNNNDLSGDINLTSGGCVASKITAPVTINVISAQVTASAATINKGQSTTLTAGAANSYAWTCNQPNCYLSAPDIRQPIASPQVTTVYTCKITVGACSAQQSVTITVNDIPIANNTISTTGNLSFNVSGDPAVITGSTPTGGTGAFTYQWQKSTTSATTGFIDIAGATGISYDPSTITQTTYYKRIVSSGTVASSTSNVITITIVPAIANNTITSYPGKYVFLYSGDPTIISGTAPTGGNGSYTYQWQSSINQSTWTNIANATNANYDPATISNTTYYRRIVNSGQVPASVSTIVTITIATISMDAVAPTTLCPGNSYGVTYTLNSTTSYDPTDLIGDNNVFTVQLSDASGSFANPTALSTTSGYSPPEIPVLGDLTIKIPAKPAGSGYRMRVTTSNPAGVSSDNGQNLTISGAVTFTTTRVCNEANTPLTNLPVNTYIVVGYSSCGNFITGNTFNIQLSDASGSFANPRVIGQGDMGNQGVGAAYASIPQCIPSGTGYRIRVVSSSPTITSTDNGVNLTINNVAGDPPGGNWNTAIPIELYCNPLEHSITKNNSSTYCFRNVLGDASNDLFYSFTGTDAMISANASFPVNVRLYNSSKTLIGSALGNGYTIYLRSQPYGTYYIAVEGVGSANGNITLVAGLECSDRIGVIEEEGIDTPGAFQLYPNPSDHTFTVSTPKIEEVNSTIQLFNLQGKLIKEIFTEKAGAEVNVSELANGLYIVQVKQGNVFTRKKLQVVH